MTPTPSLRMLWKLYRVLLARDEDLTRRDPTLAQDSFYSGARAILKIQAYLIEHGRYDELHTMTRKHGRQIDNLITSRRQRSRH